MARAQQKSAPGIKVEVSALGASESRQFFGENLAEHNVQPVWLSIENETDDQFAFLPIAMDPDYYSPYEVSYRFHGAFSLAANRAREDFFLKQQIASILPPHSKTTGFVYGVLDAGIKYAHVVIAGQKRVETFDFALPVPGPEFVGTHIRADKIYPGKNIEDLELGLLENHIFWAGLLHNQRRRYARRRSAQYRHCRKQSRSDRSLYCSRLASRQATGCGKRNRDRSRFPISG
jgi:hypothetical protein